MPTLLRSGAVSDDALPQLVAFEDWQPGSDSVPILTADAEIDERILAAPIIAIDFPVFKDGRGLSLAVLLRSRHHYEGELLAVGDVHEDILHYMYRCGFGSYLLPDERNPETALTLLTPYSDHYQASMRQPEPAFRRLDTGECAS
ncbi:MAG: DUF934 domain-containing protein [Pseudomonadales bacterium]|jgi:uncharacterized protein (DUF934 family)|nr:DUF934 domain-containing protein [Pseudomonadales bacterium]MDP6473116.1 DUF934 domain-containing protein [Pseudomonadales bacterium]MDP6826127.1 DUF934 domain-containing protein [Pseudomonadales bacterium]MDP6971497.1 DUF934 domain-containing protein [Pseudomonadales bacterium]|tara:strand:+ start:862 stop:1296 length:435 start_codon:yes stop_codon:yes gene_type:complete